MSKTSNSKSAKKVAAALENIQTAQGAKPEYVHNNFQHLQPDDVVSFWFGAEPGQQGKGKTGTGNKKYKMTVAEANAFLHEAQTGEKVDIETGKILYEASEENSKDR